MQARGKGVIEVRRSVCRGRKERRAEEKRVNCQGVNDRGRGRGRGRRRGCCRGCCRIAFAGRVTCRRAIRNLRLDVIMSSPIRIHFCLPFFPSALDWPALSLSMA